jgi:hypothetical protein
LQRIQAFWCLYQNQKLDAEQQMEVRCSLLWVEVNGCVQMRVLLLLLLLLLLAVLLMWMLKLWMLVPSPSKPFPVQFGEQ